MKNKVTKIGVLTSGGDSPGMNACVRAVVRTGIYHGLEMFGIMRGFTGMVEDDINPSPGESVRWKVQQIGSLGDVGTAIEWFLA